MENNFSMLGKNSPNIPWIMFYFMREHSLPYLTHVSGSMAQITQFVSLYCLCRLISDDMIVVEIVCL